MSLNERLIVEDEGSRHVASGEQMAAFGIAEKGEEESEVVYEKGMDHSHEAMSADGHAGVPSSIFNLTTTILGSGALVMPHVCKTTGILLFLILLSIVAVAAHYAILLLSRSIEMANLKVAKYQLVGKAAYGMKGYQLAIWSIILQQLGACILYIQIIGTILSPSETFASTNNDVLENKIFWQCFIVALIIFPLAMLKDLSALQYTSLMSLVFIMAFVIFVLSNGSDVLSNRGAHQTAVFELEADMFTVIPTISFSFVCHMNVFPIYKELKGRSVQKMSKVSSTSMFVALTLYFVAGTFGYLTFIDCTAENLINDFRVSGTSVSTIFDVLRGGYGLALIFAYPVILYEMRHCVDDVVFKGKPSPHPTRRQFLLNVVIIGFCLTLAILIHSINTVFAFIGATSGSMMVFVMPSLFYLKLQPDKWTSRKNLPALIMLIGGLILIPVCVISAILQLVGLKSLNPGLPQTCGCEGCANAGAAGSCVMTRGMNATACVFPSF